MTDDDFTTAHRFNKHGKGYWVRVLKRAAKTGGAMNTVAPGLWRCLECHIGYDEKRPPAPTKPSEGADES